MDWLSNIDSLFSLLQIGLDLCLIGVMLFLLKKRSNDFLQADRITASINKVFEETKTLSEGFDTNLRERQALMMQFLRQLDQQIEAASRVKTELEALQQELKQSPPPPNQAGNLSARHSEQRLIHQLSQQGLAPKAIAERLKKPLGEVELVLNLKSLASRD
jgi:DNA-binding NarL/FixJ family response regulator